MNKNTALLMFTVLAAFTLATATLMIPLAHEAQAIIAHLKPPQSNCHNQAEGSDIGKCARGSH